MQKAHGHLHIDKATPPHAKKRPQLHMHRATPKHARGSEMAKRPHANDSENGRTTTMTSKTSHLIGTTILSSHRDVVAIVLPALPQPYCHLIEMWQPSVLPALAQPYCHLIEMWQPSVLPALAQPYCHLIEMW